MKKRSVLFYRYLIALQILLSKEFSIGSLTVLAREGVWCFVAFPKVSTRYSHDVNCSFVDDYLLLKLISRTFTIFTRILCRWKECVFVCGKS